MESIMHGASRCNSRISRKQLAKRPLPTCTHFARTTKILHLVWLLIAFTDIIFLTNVLVVLGFVTYQYERGEREQSLHLQGYLEIRDRQRKGLRALKRYAPLDKAHLEPRRGTQQQAIEYANKDDTRAAPGATLGRRCALQQGSRTDLQALAELARTRSIQYLDEEHGGAMLRYGRYMKDLHNRQLYRSAPKTLESKRVYLLQGETGAGKTHAVVSKIPVERLVRPIVKKGQIWFPSNYDPMQHTACFFDEFDWEEVPISYTLRLLDKYPSNIEIKGSEAPFLCSTVILASNIPLSDWYPGATLEQRAALKRRFYSIITVRRSRHRRIRQPKEVTVDSDSLADSLDFDI